jgi:outer membrane protein OmpA-like peptidoglycan-associated protein/uncharacterized protein YidB (DUF937 family)
MFEQLISEAASHLNLPAGSVSTLVRGLLALMTNERTGGVEGFVDMFRRAGFGDALTSWFGGKAGRAISPAQLESALGPVALDSLAASSGLPRVTASSAAAFLLPKLIGLLTPDGLMPSDSSVLSQISTYIGSARPSAMAARSGWPAWLPWATAALLAVVVWLMFRSPTAAIEPQLALSNRDGKVTYSGRVHDENTQSAITSALKAAFGENNVSGSLDVDPNVKRTNWLPHLDDLLAALKTPGVDFSLNGDAINVGGWLSAAQRQSLTDRLHGIFGATSMIGSLGDAATDAVRAANEKALSALGAIGTSGSTPTALVQAMNLAIINFPTGSAQIPADDMPIIRKSADAIRRAPAGSKIEIGGHTDNTGDPAGNVALSEARANAVKSALVASGVNADMLTTRGYGDTKPRANNDTEYGRFQNRRIEYAVVQ